MATAVLNLKENMMTWHLEINDAIVAAADEVGMNTGTPLTEAILPPAVDVGNDTVALVGNTFRQGDRDAGPNGDIRSAQTNMVRMGIEGVGEVDGVYGRNTMNGVQDAQEMFGLPRTGVLDQATQDAFNNLTDDQIAFFTSESEAMAPAVETPVTVEATPVESSSRLGTKGFTPITLTEKAQQKLFDLGFVEVGTADGAAGANTRSAALRYQGLSDLTATGRLDVDTLGSLTSATADINTVMQRQIAHHEGQKNYPYKDSVGLWTIGIGHLIGNGTDADLANSGYSEYSRANPMPESVVKELFQEDLEEHKEIAEGYDFYDDMSEEGKRAIIDLTFNMGDFYNKRRSDGTYMWSSLRTQLDNGNWDAAADNLASSTYGTQVGQRAVTVTDLLRQAGD